MQRPWPLLLDCLANVDNVWIVLEEKSTQNKYNEKICHKYVLTTTLRNTLALLDDTKSHLLIVMENISAVIKSDLTLHL